MQIQRFHLPYLEDTRRQLSKKFGFLYRGNAMLLIDLRSKKVEFSGPYLVRGFTLTEMIRERL